MSKVFINYRRADSTNTSREIAETLSTYMEKKNVFFDEQSIEYGSEYPKQIEQHLKNADVLIIVIGEVWEKLLVERYRKAQENAMQRGITWEEYKKQHYRNDDWVYHEIRTFLDERKSNAPKKKILPVFIGRPVGIFEEVQYPDLKTAVEELSVINGVRIKEGDTETLICIMSKVLSPRELAELLKEMLIAAEGDSIEVQELIEQCFPSVVSTGDYKRFISKLERAVGIEYDQQVKKFTSFLYNRFKKNKT